MARLLGDRAQRRRRIVADQLREQRAEREDVGARDRRRRASCLLRRHESRRADHRRLGIGAAVLRDAPVHHVDLAEAADHHVLGLQVAMHDAVRVRERDGIEDAAEHGQPVGERQRDRGPDRRAAGP